ncbi:MAG: hypothetical protein JNM22_01960 [Saprospiraceae bacterium]|nr:hypothetical protein [Saprospiraceae bacterium]
MAKLHIETNEIGHHVEYDGSQQDVTMMLAMAILGSERLHNLILDALEAQPYLKEKGFKSTPVECGLINIDNEKTIN